MDFAHLPHLAKAAVLLTGVYIAYQLYIQLTLGRKRRAMRREKGTLPPVALPSRDPILGWDKFRENMQAIKEHRLLEMGLARFRQMKVNTILAVNLGRRVIITTEPENLKVGIEHS